MEPPEPSRRRRRRWRWVALVVTLALIAAAAPALVIVVSCAMRPQTAQPTLDDSPDVRQAKAAIDGYRRPGAATYFTLPEWFIVYETEEYAAFIARRRPSAFPYFRAVTQYWTYYRRMCDAACSAFPFDAGDHVMLAVIGTSFTVENALKGLYENSAGRLTEWMATNDTDEDRFAARTAADYGRFMHTIPWYDFPFGRTLAALWSQTPAWGAHPVRKWERRISLSIEYGVKAAYGWLIRIATKGAYGDEPEWVYLRAEHVPDRAFDDPRIVRKAALTDGSSLLAVKRYEPFTSAIAELERAGIHLHDVADNRRILVTALTTGEPPPLDVRGARVLIASPLLAGDRRRIAVDVPVETLGELLDRFGRSGVRLEHVYDY